MTLFIHHKNCHVNGDESWVFATTWVLQSPNPLYAGLCAIHSAVQLVLDNSFSHMSSLSATDQWRQFSWPLQFVIRIILMGRLLAKLGMTSPFMVASSSPMSLGILFEQWTGSLVQHCFFLLVFMYSHPPLSGFSQVRYGVLFLGLTLVMLKKKYCAMLHFK